MSTVTKKQAGAGVRLHKASLGSRIKRDLQKHWQLYLLFLPIFVYFVIFKYAPMAGLAISFQDFKAAKGIFGSKWVGTKHFVNFFNEMAKARADASVQKFTDDLEHLPELSKEELERISKRVKEFLNKK